MPRIRTHQTNFTAGEVSPRLLGRADLRAYENGASKLRNVFIYPTGGVRRRSGLRFVDWARGPGRLIAFEFNTQQVYLLAFSDYQLDVYRDQTWISNCSTPWSTEQLTQINWTQSADTLLIVHPDVPPKKITRTSEVEWNIVDWEFFEETYKEGNEDQRRLHIPHYKFAGDGVTLLPSAIRGTITLVASAEVFIPEHVGVRLRVKNREVEITAFTSVTEVIADVKETFPNTEITADWQEQAFSRVRGWPVSVCFHQDRLVIGGSRDLPNRLWLSKSADLFNFDLGEGLDDEAIEFSILSDQVNAIRAVFSGRHLQVFTSGAEWMVTGDPLTPTSIQLNRQTRIGSPVDRIVPPIDVDGATLFIPRNGAQLREFLFTDVEQAYQASDLALLAEHLIDTPTDMDFDKSTRLFHIVMANGTMGTLTIYRAEQVSAWTLQETAGAFRAIAVVGEQTFVLTERFGAYLIEVFDASLQVDSGLVGSSSQPTTFWSGMDHLEGQVVKIVADGRVRADTYVSGGAVVLDEPAIALQSGLPFAHILEPLPPNPLNGISGNQGTKYRPVSITFRLLDTAAFHLDTGHGLVEIPFKRFSDRVLDTPPKSFSGDKKVRAFGWMRDGTKSHWRIEQEIPLSFTLISVSTELILNT